MITYILEVRMADSELIITDEMEQIINECTQKANSTIVSQREKRTFSVIGRKDEYTLMVSLTSRDATNPTRSLSTLSRKVLENDTMSQLLAGHTPNGSVFKAQLIESADSKITFLPDTEIVSEILKIFFDTDSLPREKELSRKFAEEIRNIVIDYKNQKDNL